MESGTWTYLLLVIAFDTTIATAQPALKFDTFEQCQAERARVISSYRFSSLYGVTAHVTPCNFAREVAK